MTETAIPQPSDIPGVANAENGLVVLDGLIGLAVTLSVSAARQTAQNLLTAAAIAEGQQGISKDAADD